METAVILTIPIMTVRKDVLLSPNKITRLLACFQDGESESGDSQ